jgi:putative FmdB family regulatory protein
MPIYEYEARNPQSGCERCRDGFACLRRISDPPLTHCPACTTPVAKRISVPSLGASRSSQDRRARDAGFHKLQRTGKGEYEKKY